MFVKENHCLVYRVLSTSVVPALPV